MPVPWRTVAVVLLVGPFIHWTFSVVMFRLGLKPRPRETMTMTATLRSFRSPQRRRRALRRQGREPRAVDALGRARAGRLRRPQRRAIDATGGVDAADAAGLGIGLPTAIVRSSAVGEDSPDASFAGQLDSIPDVTTPDALRDAIARVWASQRSARVLAYQAARGITLAGMGIIIQRQVQASLSGVLFTVSPTDPGEMLLEYCGGMGDALVSGAVNPGRVSIRRPRATRRLAPAAMDEDRVA